MRNMKRSMRRRAAYLKRHRQGEQSWQMDRHCGLSPRRREKMGWSISRSHPRERRSAIYLQELQLLGHQGLVEELDDYGYDADLEKAWHDSYADGGLDDWFWYDDRYDVGYVPDTSEDPWDPWDHAMDDSYVLYDAL